MKPLKPLYKGLYYVVMVIAMAVVRLVYPVRVLGRENLPPEGKQGYVLAPNHLSAIDPLFHLLARGWRPKMLIMGKDELFHINGLLNFFWAVAGAFPVDRGTGNRAPLDAAIAEVKKGRDLLIYPEGTRSKTGQLGRLKSGAFVVAQSAGAAMVPSIIWYKAGKPKPFNRITIAFGRPLTLEQLGLTGEYSAKALREAKKVYVAALEELRAENESRF